MTKTCLSFSGDFSNDFTVPKGHGRRECNKNSAPSLLSVCVFLEKMPQSDVVFINSVTLRLTKPPRKKQRRE